jgi:hypothetical protein
MDPYGTQPRAPEPPTGPDNLVDDGLGTDARDARPQAPRWHGGIRDPGHPEFFDVDHRQLPDPVDVLDQPERRLVVDAYESMVRGAGADTAPPPGVASDPTGLDAARLERRPDAEPGST